jgi:phosphate butyryltransferase
MITTFAQLELQAKDRPSKLVAVAMAEETDVLTALAHAFAADIVQPILVGEPDAITAAAEKCGADISPFRIVEARGEDEAAAAAVKMVRTGEADLLMKGKVPTATLMKAVFNKETGLKSEGVLSHVTVIEIPQFKKMIFMSDPGLNIEPDLKTKAAIITNAVAVAHRFGIEKPKVAVVGAVEKVNPAMPTTIDAAALSKMADRGQIRGCLIDGPFALDNALSKKSCETKGIETEVGGDLDILLMPNIDAANIFYKTMAYLTEYRMAGIIMGGGKPIILTSRADSDAIKYNSILTGVSLA